MDMKRIYCNSDGWININSRTTISLPSLIRWKDFTILSLLHHIFSSLTKTMFFQDMEQQKVIFYSSISLSLSLFLLDKRREKGWWWRWKKWSKIFLLQGTLLPNFFLKSSFFKDCQQIVLHCTLYLPRSYFQILRLIKYKARFEEKVAKKEWFFKTSIAGAKTGNSNYFKTCTFIQTINLVSKNWEWSLVVTSGSHFGAVAWKHWQERFQWLLIVCSLKIFDCRRRTSSRRWEWSRGCMPWWLESVMLLTSSRHHSWSSMIWVHL